ncbi:MAG: DUF3862 domain-containing protein [bacterium]|nr:DUF3862 domain-containing protein [bacterium]MCP5069887.1 DUF3862 domain-containing protein [bacterium]
MKKLAKEMKLLILGTTLVMLVPSVCAVILVGVGMSVNDVETQDLNKAEDPPPIVTLAEFEQLREGMSIQEVVAIVGAPGVVSASGGNDANGQTRMSVWQNSDASHMNVTFENGQLVTKAQLYLK